MVREFAPLGVDDVETGAPSPLAYLLALRDLVRIGQMLDPHVRSTEKARLRYVPHCVLVAIRRLNRIGLSGLNRIGLSGLNRIGLSGRRHGLLRVHTMVPTRRRALHEGPVSLVVHPRVDVARELLAIEHVALPSTIDREPHARGGLLAKRLAHVVRTLLIDIDVHVFVGRRVVLVGVRVRDLVVARVALSPFKSRALTRVRLRTNLPIVVVGVHARQGVLVRVQIAIRPVNTLRETGAPLRVRTQRFALVDTLVLG